MVKSIHNSPSRRLHEVEDVVHVAVVGELCADQGDALVHGEAAVIDYAVHLVDVLNLLRRELVPPEADEVEAAIGGGLAGHGGVGRYVLAGACAAAEHGVAAYAAELVDQHAGANHGKIVHYHLSGNLGAVANDTAAGDKLIILGEPSAFSSPLRKESVSGC